MPTIDNEYSTPKITPADGVKIPSVGENSGYQLDKELREYIQEGVTGVTEEYSTLMTYAYGKRLKHEGVEYRCIVPVESPEIFDPDKWVKVDLTELDKRVLENASAINAINGVLGNSSVLAGSGSNYISMVKIGTKGRLLNFRRFQINGTYSIDNLDGEIASYYMIPCALTNSSNSQNLGVLIVNENSSTPKLVRLRESSGTEEISAEVSCQIFVMIK